MQVQYDYDGGMPRVSRRSFEQNYKFTGKERDTESGLDYFGARHYASLMGRWMVPDWAAKPTAVPYAMFGNPQSLNLYGYVGNNPLFHFDPDGHCWPAQSCYQAITNSVTNFSNKVLSSSASSSPAVSALKTFGAGVLADTVKMALSPLTMGTATGTCMGGSGCSAGGTALAVGGDILKGAAIAGGLSAAAGSLTGAATTDLAAPYFHYGYLEDAPQFANGLRAGAYATTDGTLTGAEAQSTLSLPNRIQGPPNAVYPITPEPGTPVTEPSTVLPQFGQPGGGLEVRFPQGTGPGTVGDPTALPDSDDE